MGFATLEMGFATLAFCLGRSGVLNGLGVEK